VKSLKLICSTVISIMLITSFVYAMTVQEYIAEATEFNESGDLSAAISTLNNALLEYPDEASLLSYKGFYTGMKAGQTKNYMEAGQLVQEAYQLLDRVVELRPDYYLVYFHRGILSVNVPEFLGKLDTGIDDLVRVVDMAKRQKNDIHQSVLMTSYSFLAKAYVKKDEQGKAKDVWKKMVKLDSNSPEGKRAAAELEAIEARKKPAKVSKLSNQELKKMEKRVSIDTNPEEFTELGYAYLDKREYEKARDSFNKSIAHDSTNLSAYEGLIETIGEMAALGYDEKIYSNTEHRTNLAFEISNLTSLAAKKFPENPKMRLLKGIIGVEMPFFVGKLDESMEDLNWVLEHKSSTDELRAEALYYLGYAYKKKAMTNWIKVVTDFPKTESAKHVFSTMSPRVQRINENELKRPVVIIDFVLGFQDELAPQTAVWIESEDGRFIKTIYVSGFSGFAREKQVNLAKWSKSSDYRDVDAVTAASIDMGHHIYVWDLLDYEGKKVGTGKYRVNVEVSYWPSMQYQMVSSDLTLAKTEYNNSVDEGRLIPYLEVKYLPLK